MPYGILALAIVDMLPAVVMLATIGAHVYWFTLARETRTLLGFRTSAAPRIQLDQT
jgi:hypothetical protein